MVLDSASDSGSWSRQAWYSACRVRSSARAAAHRAGLVFGRGGGGGGLTGTPAARRSRCRRCRSAAVMAIAAYCIPLRNGCCITALMGGLASASSPRRRSSDGVGRDRGRRTSAVAAALGAVTASRAWRTAATGASRASANRPGDDRRPGCSPARGLRRRAVRAGEDQAVGHVRAKSPGCLRGSRAALELPGPHGEDAAGPGPDVVVRLGRHGPDIGKLALLRHDVAQVGRSRPGAGLRARTAVRAVQGAILGL